MKSMVITGTSSGIGRACALTLDHNGFRVFAGVRETADGDALRQAASDRLTPVLVDVTDDASITAIAEQVAGRVGDAGLAGLVNNAGTTLPCPIEYLPLDGFRHQLEVNLIGPLAVTQALLPLLRRGRGRVVNITSAAGKAGVPPRTGPGPKSSLEPCCTHSPATSRPPATRSAPPPNGCS